MLSRSRRSVSFVTDFTVRKYLTGEEYSFNLDTAEVYTKELKEKLEPLTGIPVSEQELVFEGRMMKDENHLLEGSLHSDRHKVVLFRKGEKYPKDNVEPPEDYDCEENPLYKSMALSLSEHLKPEDLRKLVYHMMQYTRQIGDRVSLQHLDMVAEQNLEKYVDILKGRRKQYYEIYEKCYYLDRKMNMREDRRNAEQARQTAHEQKMKAVQERVASLKSSEARNN